MLNDAEIDRIRVGNVVKIGPAYRTVRAVHTKDGRPYYFAFAIRRCSWTHRPYTIILRPELRQRAEAVYYVSKNVRATKIERRLQENIDDDTCRTCDCCEVRGVVD
jgi:hypothetical protein